MADDNMEEYSEEQIKAQKVINEEYKIWKKNAPALYSTIWTRALEWPSLTTQWFPDAKKTTAGYTERRLLLGTLTSGHAQESLMIAKLNIPDFNAPDEIYNEATQEVGGHQGASKPFSYEITQRINTQGEVNKARYMPSNPDIIASMGPAGIVHIFDRTKHPLMPKDSTVRPEIELVGHTSEGFAMAWSPKQEGLLATGGLDDTVRLWDVKAGYSKYSKQIDPIHTLEHHSSAVNDIDFAPGQLNFHIFASVSDDKTLAVVDVREGKPKTPYVQKEVSTSGANCVSFNPVKEGLIATGHEDGTISVWDFRVLRKKLHSFDHHTKGVKKLQWSPKYPSMLVSGGDDRRIMVWNLIQNGGEQEPDDAEDGPPDLIFIHGGFTHFINDFDFDYHDPFRIVAAAEDNQLQVFRPQMSLLLPKKKADSTEMTEVDE